MARSLLRAGVEHEEKRGIFLIGDHVAQRLRWKRLPQNGPWYVCVAVDGWVVRSPGSLRLPDLSYLKFVFINRDEKSLKKPRNMDQSLIHEAEHDNLLKVLEKNLEIPQDCTYADQKALDAQVSPQDEAVPGNHSAARVQAVLSVTPQCRPESP